MKITLPRNNASWKSPYSEKTHHENPLTSKTSIMKIPLPRKIASWIQIFRARGDANLEGKCDEVEPFYNVRWIFSLQIILKPAHDFAILNILRIDMRHVHRTRFVISMIRFYSVYVCRSKLQSRVFACIASCRDGELWAQLLFGSFALVI